jgi:hypothetical protein
MSGLSSIAEGSDIKSMWFYVFYVENIVYGLGFVIRLKE